MNQTLIAGSLPRQAQRKFTHRPEDGQVGDDDGEGGDSEAQGQDEEDVGSVLQGRPHLPPDRKRYPDSRRNMNTLVHPDIHISHP